MGITHMPDKSIVALNILGQSMIITGFVGVGIAAIYALKTKKKSS
jgi:Zn-dependent alcohol dehydrogenase